MTESSGIDRYVAPLGAFGRDDLASAGGKGANLGELVRTAAPVPDGFVVTTDAYAANIDAMSDSLRVAIANAYRDLGAGPVAVRSSATAEDLPGAAFAGQQDTYLGITGDAALLDAVGRCWGSLWTDRAIAYRRRLGIDDNEVRIAVVVQRMVDADIAGVLFTANPVTGRREQTVVDASPGLGEAVVSGLVTPDHYVLDADGKVEEWTPGRREVVIRSSGSGTTHEAGTATSERLLADDVLEELHGQGRSVAAHFGRPQDIEWAYADGKVWLLQARPMTALPPPPLKLNRRQRLSASVGLDYLPVRPYPIDMTTWVPYGPAGMMTRIAESFGISGVFENFLLETDGVVDRFVPPSPHPNIRFLATPIRLLRKAHQYDPARWTEDPRYVDFRARVRELAKQDPAALPWRELTQMPRRALDLIEPVTDLRADYLPAVGIAMLRLLVSLKRLGQRDRLGELIHGARTRTTDANDALAALADQVRENPQLWKAVDALDLERANEFDEFRTGFEAYLEEYGHREVASPILVTPPTLGESPETVLGLIKVLAAQPSTSADNHDALRELLDHPRLRDPKRRERLRRQVEAARAGIAFREDSHFYFTMPLPILRRSLLELGQRMCDVGVLTDREQVFHFRLEELEAIDDIAGLTDMEAERLRGIVRQRSAKRAELEGVPLIDKTLVFPPSKSAADALVTGTSASSGTATGAVRVIHDPAEFANLESGDVLVCPYTNPSWTPLFQRAAAVVVDSGGPGSHAAIVAREYGIPAVMGTGTGTSVLANGQLVTVDGGAGRVTAAERE